MAGCPCRAGIRPFFLSKHTALFKPCAVPALTSRAAIARRLAASAKENNQGAEWLCLRCTCRQISLSSNTTAIAAQSAAQSANSAVRPVGAML